MSVCGDARGAQQSQSARREAAVVVLLRCIRDDLSRRMREWLMVLLPSPLYKQKQTNSCPGNWGQRIMVHALICSILRTYHPPVLHLRRRLWHGGIIVSFCIETGELNLSTFDIVLQS